MAREIYASREALSIQLATYSTLLVENNQGFCQHAVRLLLRVGK